MRGVVPLDAKGLDNGIPGFFSQFITLFFVKLRNLIFKFSIKSIN